MVTIDTLEGVINDTLSYHYDVGSDVLYLRLRTAIGRTNYGEETDDGLILLRDTETDNPAGLTIVNWWQRFGQGALPDSIQSIQRQIEPLATRLAA